MSFVDTMVERNANFAESEFDPTLQIRPTTGTIVVGCVDPRVDPAYVLGLEQGETAVIRNVGGRVDRILVETLAVLQVVATAPGPRKGARQLVLLQHTDCGIVSCYHQAPDLLARYMGVERSGLEELAITDPYRAVVHDIETLKANPQLPDDMIVSGLVYDVKTGRVEIVAPPAPLRQA